MGSTMHSTHMVDMGVLTRLLRNHKEYRGVSWDQAAEQMGLTSTTLFAFMSGRNVPSGHVLVSMLWWLGVQDIGVVTVRRDGSPVKEPSIAGSCACCGTVASANPPRYRSGRVDGKVCWECSFEDGCAHVVGTDIQTRRDGKLMPVLWEKLETARRDPHYRATLDSAATAALDESSVEE